jgi:hypothetical protein
MIAAEAAAKNLPFRENPSPLNTQVLPRALLPRARVAADAERPERPYAKNWHDRLTLKTLPLKLMCLIGAIRKTFLFSLLRTPRGKHKN